MRLLTEYLSTKVNASRVVPKNGQQLYDILKDEIKRLGFTGNFNHIDVSHVTCFDNIFYNPDTYLWFNGDVSEWDVHNMKSCKFMFSCTQFDGDLSQWDVSNCENFNSMFNRTSHFTGKGLENWNIRSAKILSYMFHKTYSFTGESVKDWKLPAKVEETDNMFKNACALEADFSKWNVSKIPIRKRSQMFDHCHKMKVEWLPKGIDPNMVDFSHNANVIAELKGMHNKVQKEEFI